MTILGISLGTNRTGVCVLKDGTLLDRHLHRFDEIISEEKMKAIIARYRRYLDKHLVAAIVVKIPPLFMHNDAIRYMMVQVETLAKEYDCLFDLTTKGELKRATDTRTTKELIQYTLRLYPELTSLHEKGEPGKYNYYRKIFEAALTAHVFGERQKARARRMGIPT